MSTHDSDGPSPMPPAYSALLERLALPLALEAVHITLARAFDLDAKQHADHDESVLRVLLTLRLAPDGMMRAKDISARIVKSTSHTSRLIDRAEAHGLVERRPDPRDRRAHRVALTRRGEAEIDAYVPHAVTLLDEALSGALSPAELQMVVDLVGRVETTALELVAKREAARQG